MSLVNDMLKDLDRRQAPDQNPVPSAGGYGALTAPQKRALSLPLTFAVVVGVLLLVVALLWYFRGFFIDKIDQATADQASSQSGAIERPEPPQRSAESIVENIGDSLPALAIAAAKLEQKSNTSVRLSPASENQQEQQAPELMQASEILSAESTEQSSLKMAESQRPAAPASTVIHTEKTTVSAAPMPVVQGRVAGQAEPKIPPAQKSASTEDAVTSAHNASAPAQTKSATTHMAAKAPTKVAPPTAKAKPQEVTNPGLNKVVVKTPEQKDAAAVEEARHLLTNRGALVSQNYLRETIPQLDYHDASSEFLVLLMIQSGDGEQSLQMLQQFPVRSAALDAQLRARVMQSQGNVEAAIELMQKVPVAVADAPDHHVMLAVLYQQAGRYADAVTEYAGLVGVNDSVGNWWAGLGMALEGVGQPAAAQRSYGRARQLSNLSPELDAYISKRLDYLQAQNWN